MKLIENEFKHKGVNFKVIKRGKKALILEAEADFYDCKSIEVWKIRHSKASIIKGNRIDERERKPSNEDYPSEACQYMLKRYTSYSEMLNKAELKFLQFENRETVDNINN